MMVFMKVCSIGFVFLSTVGVLANAEDNVFERISDQARMLSAVTEKTETGKL